MTENELELTAVNNNNVESERSDEVTPANGTCSPPHAAGATEIRPLLSPVQGAESNGECSVQITEQPSVFKQLIDELNGNVVWKIRVWMVILFTLIFIVLVVLLSLFLCSGQKDDVDDKYEASLFVKPLFFNGSFTLSNKSFEQNSTSQPNSDSTLFNNLEQKLNNIYKSSYALGRYFSSATITTLRQPNASVQYQLKFVMPEENEQLTRYTLSKEVVYYVLLQHLYDQDTEDPFYIEASSLIMDHTSLRHSY